MNPIFVGMERPDACPSCAEETISSDGEEGFFCAFCEWFDGGDDEVMRLVGAASPECQFCQTRMYYELRGGPEGGIQCASFYECPGCGFLMPK
jgi:hypothetical protein